MEGLLSLLGLSGLSDDDAKSFMSGLNTGFDDSLKKNTQSLLLNPALYSNTNNAQNNASGSNASLDKSLDDDARKVAGVSEGGATPQLNSFTDYMKKQYPNLYGIGKGLFSYLSGGK